ncbi:MAG: DMT family transporter [Flavobacteriaceae bacterium]|jgi:drug/metabolite transporter (DMT)-like permease|nr:DMT family transporter [Flavobacteriaceae bacterium]
MQKNNLKHFIHLHFLVFIAGFTAVLGELITNSSVSIVWHRMLIASILTIFFILLKNKNLKINLKQLLKYSFLGLIIALHWITFFEGIEQSNISVTLAMFSTAAFFTSFLEPLFFKRKIIFYEIILGLLVVIGVFLIFKAEFNFINGIILGILSAFFASLFSVLNGIMIQKDSAFKISFYEFFSGVIFITIYLILTDNIITLNIENYLSLNYLYIFILGSVCTAYAFIASVYLLKFISPYSVVLTYNLEPIYGILLALLFFGENEKMSFQFYIGLFLILSSVLINMYVKKTLNKG